MGLKVGVVEFEQHAVGAGQRAVPPVREGAGSGDDAEPFKAEVKPVAPRVPELHGREGEQAGEVAAVREDEAHERPADFDPPLEPFAPEEREMQVRRPALKPTSDDTRSPENL